MCVCETVSIYSMNIWIAFNDRKKSRYTDINKLSDSNFVFMKTQKKNPYYHFTINGQADHSLPIKIKGIFTTFVCWRHHNNVECRCFFCTLSVRSGFADTRSSFPFLSLMHTLTNQTMGEWAKSVKTETFARENKNRLQIKRRYNIFGACGSTRTHNRTHTCKHINFFGVSTRQKNSICSIHHDGHQLFHSSANVLRLV